MKMNFSLLWNAGSKIRVFQECLSLSIFLEVYKTNFHLSSSSLPSFTMLFFHFPSLSFWKNHFNLISKIYGIERCVKNIDIVISPLLLQILLHLDLFFIRTPPAAVSSNSVFPSQALR
jgi:hypothetical protein